MTNTDKILVEFDERFKNTLVDKEMFGEGLFNNIRVFLIIKIAQAITEERQKMRGVIEKMESSLDSDERHHTLIEVLNFIDSIQDELTDK